MRKIGIIMIMTGILLLSFYFAYYFGISNKEKEEIDNYITETSIIDESNISQEETNEEIIEEVKQEEQKQVVQKLDYKAILEIPKINLNNGLVETTKNFDSINYAISIDKNSNYPNENGNFILYAHSGSSRIAFFKNLNKVDISDNVVVYYEGIKYTYQITNKYEIEKNGKLKVFKYEGKKLITLLTCISNTNKQVVLIGEQIKNEIY